MFPPLLAALAMAKESELKTILQVYVSSISATNFCWERFLPLCSRARRVRRYACPSVTYFGLGLAGDPTPFIVATILYTFCVAPLNMVGATIPSQVAAMQVVALGGFLLVFLLSGLIFPIENIPVDCVGSRISCGRYYIEVVRDALLQGGGWLADWWKSRSSPHRLGFYGLDGSACANAAQSVSVVK